jgi:hypothetical protein
MANLGKHRGIAQTDFGLGSLPSRELVQDQSGFLS